MVVSVCLSLSLSLSLASFAKNHVFSTLGTLRSFDLWIQNFFWGLIPWQRCFKIFFMDLDLREHHFPATWKSRKWSKSTFYILIGLANRKSRLLILTFYLIYFDFMLCMDLLRVGRAHLRLCFGSPLRACQPSDSTLSSQSLRFWNICEKPIFPTAMGKKSDFCQYLENGRSGSLGLNYKHK